MIFEGCSGQSGRGRFIEKKCPGCGQIIEMFSTDTQITCENCGAVLYNDTLDCVRWCEHAKECVGEELYEKYMQGLEKQNEPADPGSVKYYSF